jgi:hypothetical protein
VLALVLATESRDSGKIIFFDYEDEDDYEDE